MYNLARTCVKSRFPRLGAPIPLLDGFLHDTGFFWRVDRRNLSLADVEAFSVDTDFGFEVPSPVSSESDARRSDSFLSVPESGTFLFPFSLRVNRLLGFLRGPSLHYSPTLHRTGRTDSVVHSVHLTEVKSDSRSRFRAHPEASRPH